MEVVRAILVHPVWPALAGSPAHPLARLEVETEGAAEPCEVSEIHFRLVRSGAVPLGPVQIWYCGERQELASGTSALLFEGAPRFAALPGPVGDSLALPAATGRQVLHEGRNCFWFSVAVDAEADLDGRLGVRVDSLRLADGTQVIPREEAGPRTQRLGLALRSAGDDGAAVYRIPGLTTTTRGTLIAVYDIRWRDASDLPASIDVGMSRSTDGGRHFEPMQIIMDMGDAEEHRFDGVGDPSILVDPATGRLWVAALWSHGDRGWRGSGPGLTPDETGQLVLAHSDDDGRTWSDPVSITPGVKDPRTCLLLQGPGRGIALADGTLVFPAQFQAAPEQGRQPFATLLSSQDHGASWQLGTGAHPDTTEAQVVELAPGRLLLNMRYDRAPHRIVAVTSDLGRTWSLDPSTRQVLPEPGACQASLLHVVVSGAEWLLFCNPNVAAPPRRRMTLQASADQGHTWTRRLLLDEGRGAGYSCMTRIDEETLGVLYEGSRAQLTFQRIPLRDIIEGD